MKTYVGYKTLGEALRAVRKQQGLSQSEVAQRAGVSQSTLSRIEAGHLGFHLSDLLALAEAMGTHIELQVVGHGPATDSV